MIYEIVRCAMVPVLSTLASLYLIQLINQAIHEGPRSLVYWNDVRASLRITGFVASVCYAIAWLDRFHAFRLWSEWPFCIPLMFRNIASICMLASFQTCVYYAVQSLKTLEYAERSRTEHDMVQGNCVTLGDPAEIEKQTHDSKHDSKSCTLIRLSMPIIMSLLAAIVAFVTKLWTNQECVLFYDCALFMSSTNLPSLRYPHAHTQTEGCVYRIDTQTWSTWQK